MGGSARPMTTDPAARIRPVTGSLETAAAPAIPTAGVKESAPVPAKMRAAVPWAGAALRAHALLTTANKTAYFKHRFLIRNKIRLLRFFVVTLNIVVPFFMFR